VLSGRGLEITSSEEFYRLWCI